MQKKKELMKRYLTIFFTLCVSLAFIQVEALNRDYRSGCSHHFRGQKTGFVSGKYGVNISTPAGAFKVCAPKKDNTMFEDGCTASLANQPKILEGSGKKATFKKEIVTDSDTGTKIWIKSPNVKYHVMQPKHAWHKVIEISGNVEKDFEKVRSLLENESIFQRIISYLPNNFLKERSSGRIMKKQ